MTRVGFYLIDPAGTKTTLTVACVLAEKAHAAGHRVFVYADDDSLCQRLDELLWTFRQGSFVPHARVEQLQGPQDPTPVLIGAGDPPPGFDDIMLNLGSRIPEFFSRFERCLEVVPADDREAARDRYRFYHSRGYPLETHKIQ